MDVERGKEMIDYVRLVVAILCLVSSIVFAIRFFGVRKDYSVTSFLAVGVQACAFLVLILGIYRMDMGFVNKAEVNFVYGSNSVVETLTEQELETVRDILDGRRLHRDNPSCGFSEEISIKLNDEMTLCLARDGCPIIYWKEKNLYITLTEEEQKQLEAVLSKYNVTFPCL